MDKDWNVALGPRRAPEWELAKVHPNTDWPKWPPRDVPGPRPEVFDFQDLYARYLDGTKSGNASTAQPWAVYAGNGEGGQVTAGMFDSIGTSASYLEALVNGKKVDRLGAEWIFDDRGGTLTDSGTLCLVSWADGGIVANGFGRRTSTHVTITQNAVQWYVRTETPGSQTNVTLLSTQLFKTRLPANTPIRANVYADFANKTGVVNVEGHAEYLWVDPRIVGHDGEVFACWEPFYSGNANASRIKIAKTWANARS